MPRADLVVHDDAPIDEIDEAIRRALDTPDLDPRIRQAFINARLDQRNRKASTEQARRTTRVLVAPETR